VTDWEPLEGVLVQFEDVTITESFSYGEYGVAIGPEAVDFRLDDMVWPEAGTIFGLGDTVDAITGLIHFSYMDWKLQPRYLADLVGHTPYAPPPPSCEGADRCLVDLDVGDLVITEIMFNPAFGTDATSEWVEVYNATDGSVNLNGLLIVETDGADAEIAADLIVGLGGRAVLAVGSGDAFGYDFVPDGFYGSLSLSNTGDELSVWAGPLMIDWAPSYGPLDIEAGHSFQLDASVETAEGNDLAENWCQAATIDADIILGTGISPDFGTPSMPGRCTEDD
jgi:hypothetical protein